MAGLFCHSCFNLCSVFEEGYQLLYFLDFKGAKSAAPLWHILQILFEYCKYVNSIFRFKYCNSWLFSDIGRNNDYLLGNRKQIAKFLMRTFACHSTFLYAYTSKNLANKSCVVGPSTALWQCTVHIRLPSTETLRNFRSREHFIRSLYIYNCTYIPVLITHCFSGSIQIMD